MSLLSEIATRVASATGLTVETSLFRGETKTSPDVQGAVYSKGGQAAEFLFGVDGIGRERPSVQLVFRGVPHDVDGPTAMARAAMEDLAKVADEDLSGTRYFIVTPQQSEPFELKRDESQRVYVAIGFDIYKAKS